MRHHHLASSILLWTCGLSAHALSSTTAPNKGSAAEPMAKKKIAVLGCGGYLGAMTFGFLQRASSLYGTGVGSCRCIGATSDTAVRLNSILSKNFCLAHADESFIKLTDLSSVRAIQSRLEGWDALIFGTDLFLQPRSVTPNTYERTPNDKAWEVYWDVPKGSFTDLELSSEAAAAKARILQNLLVAVRQANIQHMVVVDSDGSYLPELDSAGVPYTCIRAPRLLTETPNYTFKAGVCGDLVISSAGDDGGTGGGGDPVCREDLAALCVQSLQSLSWEQSRCLSVASNGPAVQLPTGSHPKMRVDQQWCVNSFVLQDKLTGIA